jgi:hypothetical protein
LLRSVGLTVAERFPTELPSAAAALETAPQLPADTAEDSWLSWLDKVLDWSVESRPAPPPQAAMSREVAKPSPPARMARRR